MRKTKSLLIVAAVFAAAASFDNVEIHVLPVRDNIYMLVGAGGNITVQIGKDGILLVDTEYAQLSDKILAAIRKLSSEPLHYIINTHYHADHTSGNENLRKAGSTIAGDRRYAIENGPSGFDSVARSPRAAASARSSSLGVAVTTAARRATGPAAR